MSNNKKNDDSEDIVSVKDDVPDDITSIMNSGFNSIKISVFIFILFIYSMSDVFVIEY